MFTTTGPDRLQRVHAAVTTAPDGGVTEEQLHRWVRERNGPLFAPPSILLLPDIPLSTTGKPDRCGRKRGTSRCPCSSR
ncbi:hypothetical protein [Streptomyces sp. NPDC004728]|uniref:hypothetical protein n=1 Tax=Streptomyces sp. NPDC004728 TaxID=3154289 RepID=UPI00339F86A4